MSDLMMAF